MVNGDDGDDNYEEENYDVVVVVDDEKTQANLMPRSMPRVCSALSLLITIRKTVSA